MSKENPSPPILSDPLNNLEKWQTVLLDTGIVFHVLRYLAGKGDEKSVFVAKLVRTLENLPTVGNKPRRFLVSTITLSEIVNIGNENQLQEFIEKIVLAIGSENVDIVAFDERTAVEMNSIASTKLSRKKELSQFARDLGFHEGELHVGREWILKDAMIAQTGKTNKADVALTMDSNSFRNTAALIGLSTVVVEKRFFVMNKGDNPMHYDRAKVDAVLGVP